MHKFLIISVSLIPEWTKTNVPTYPFGRFSTNGEFLLLDDAHPESTYLKWLGPNADQLPIILQSAVTVTRDEFRQMLIDPQSVWYVAPEAE